MNAEINLVELRNALAAVTKGIRGKRARERARALMVFQSTGVSVEFNNMVVTCQGHVSETGTYSLDPFIFRALLDTYSGVHVAVRIDAERITIGRSRIEHALIHGCLDRQEETVETWKLDQKLQLEKRQRRLEKEAEWNRAARNEPADPLAYAKHVAYRRSDGGIEYGAAVLKYEKGEPGNRRVYVKTTDFLEGWISELEIVSFGEDPKLPEVE